MASTHRSNLISVFVPGWEMAEGVRQKHFLAWSVRDDDRLVSRGTKPILLGN